MDLTELKKQVDDSIKEHEKHQTSDSYLYNGSVIAAIVISSAAAILVDDLPIVAKILSALSAVIIAVDRALNWGARWVFQRQMRHEYLLIMARITLVENMGDNFSEDEKKKYFLLIFDDLFALRKKESFIPGVAEVGGKK